MVAPHPDDREVLNALAFDAAPMALSLLDLDGRQLTANPAFLELFGLAAGDLAGSTALNITHPDDQERTRDYLVRLASGDEAEVVVEKRYVRADGSSFVGRLIARPLRDTNGEIVALLGSITDLTQQEIFEQVQRTLAAERAVSKVAAHTAHELNNLLAGLLLRLDLADANNRGAAVTIQPSTISEIRDLLERATRLGAGLLRHSGDDLAGIGPVESAPAAVEERPLVLVVDDEVTLLGTVAEILRMAGYDVVVAASGAEAIETARTQQIGLLVTDLVMPAMDGVTLAEQLRHENPDLPVLFITGHAGGELARRLPGDATVLRKPFRALELVSSIARLAPEVA
jgi:PAS domain S-box-containing protein